MVRRDLWDHDERYRTDAYGEGSGRDIDPCSAHSGERRKTYATNDMIVTLASATIPVFRPNPTPSRERIAPVAETDRSCFRPTRCHNQRVSIQWGWSVHAGD